MIDKESKIVYTYLVTFKSIKIGVLKAKNLTLFNPSPWVSQIIWMAANSI
jgi:hypothetical protein